MEKYLEALYYSPKSLKYMHLYLRVELFIKGEISKQELTYGLNKEEENFIFYMLNYIIDYVKQTVRFYIEVPNSNKPSTNPKCIYSTITNIDGRKIFLGPERIVSHPFYTETLMHIKSKGNKLDISGCLLTYKDYLKIIKSNIISEQTETPSPNWIYSYLAKPLEDEVLESIYFKEEEYYIDDKSEEDFKSIIEKDLNDYPRLNL